MFVGHYAVALGAKRADPGTSLGWTFFGVQFLDILWAPAILIGLEKARVVPGFLPASPLDLYYMPWTHSLVMAVAWAWMFVRIFKRPVVGFCVFSHWLLDFVAHSPDLPVLRGGPFLGLGLWRWREATFGVECGLLLVGLAIYLRSTRAVVPMGAYAMPAFVAVLIGAEAISLYGPVPGSIQAVALMAEASYAIFAVIAWRLDRFREPVIHAPVKLAIETGE